jgi:nitric oxide synthase oxygenase domain/subunit
LLPLILSSDIRSGNLLIRNIPEEKVIIIPITHPTYAKEFRKLDLKWYALPALSSMVLEIGGIEYPCCPFNGW